MPLDHQALLRSTQWWELAGHPTDSLSDAWRKLHHALQPAAELAKAFGVPQDDDSHTAFEWVNGRRIIDGYFVGQLIETPRGVVRSALRPFDMVLYLIGSDGRIYTELNLAEKTVEQAHGWVLTEAMNLFDMPVRQATERVSGLPDDPVAQGDAFPEPNQLALIELVRLYANTASIASAVARDAADVDSVLCWPHHFDLASLEVLSRNRADEMMATVGFGVTPPDQHSKAGYWYVSSWISPKLQSAEGGQRAALPKLETGKWLEQNGTSSDAGGLMAILEIDALHGIEDEFEQQAKVLSFVTQAYNACRAHAQQLLGS